MYIGCIIYYADIKGRGDPRLIIIAITTVFLTIISILYSSQSLPSRHLLLMSAVSATNWEFWKCHATNKPLSI